LFCNPGLPKDARNAARGAHGRNAPYEDSETRAPKRTRTNGQKQKKEATGGIRPKDASVLTVLAIVRYRTPQPADLLANLKLLT